MRESRDKRGGFHFKKAKKPDYSRDKKREIKRIAKRGFRYLEDGVRILAIIVVFYFFLKKKRKLYKINFTETPIFTGSHKMDKPTKRSTMKLVFLFVSRK